MPPRVPRIMSKLGLAGSPIGERPQTRARCGKTKEHPPGLANNPTYPRDKHENPWAGFAGFLNNGFYGTFGFFKKSQFLANLRHFRQFFNCFRSSGHNYCLLVHLKWYKTRIGKCQDFLYHGTVEE